MLCIVDCISEKKMQAEGHNQKMELLQSAPTRMPLLNASFMAHIFYFSSFLFSLGTFLPLDYIKKHA